MPNAHHVYILSQGKARWSRWREEHPEIEPDLSGADLRGIKHKAIDFSGANLKGTDLSDAILREVIFSGADLREADFSGAHLYKADFGGANLNKANLNGAMLNGANLSRAELFRATLSGAILTRAELWEANLTEVNLNGANLSKTELFRANLNGVNLRSAILVNANLKGATLTECSIYGISTWNLVLDGAEQENLVITDEGEPIITVDNIEVAQFIYLLLNNPKIRDIIDTITSKVVLILGRFTPNRKAVLDALRDELRSRNYIPVLFDFEKPVNRDITETVSTLAHMARFVIADITEPKSILQEFSHIIPFLPSVPIVPLLQVSEHEYGMFEHFISYPWVQPIYYYRDMDELLHSMQEQVINPAEEKVKELAIEKARRLERV